MKARSARTATRPRGRPGRKPGNKPPGKRGAAPGPLTPSGLTSGKGHIEAVGTMRREQRKADAVRLLDQNLTYEQIGQQLGVSAKTICLDLQEAYRELHAQNMQNIEHRRLREERASLLRDRAVLPLLYGQVPRKRRVVGRGKRARVVTESADPATVVTAQTRAHAALTSSGRFRAELFGMNAPIKIAPTDPTGARRYHDLTTEELQRVMAQQMAILGAALPKAIGGGDGDGQPAKAEEGEL